MLLLLKAQIKNAHTADLFAQPVVVAGHVSGGHAVAPYIAIRHKAPPEIARTRALIVPAHPERAASDARIDAALVAEKEKKIGHVEPGEILRSKSGRILSPVPKFNPGGGGARRSVSKIQEWLVKEAQLEGVDTGENVWLRDMVAELNPKNLSSADADLLNDILFGSPRGPGPEHRVKPVIITRPARAAA